MPCGKAVPHLNELHEKLAAEGLTVVGVTSEDKGSTEKWAKEKGPKYAYAYDSGGKLARACGVSAIPHSILVDVTGKIVYSGGPEGVSVESVRPLLAGALKKPLWELPKTFAKVRAAVAKGDYAQAIKECEVLAAQKDAPPEAATTGDALKSVVTGAMRGASETEQTGDVLAAKREYERIAKTAKGLPEEEAAKARLAAIATDPALQKALKSLQDLEKILDLPAKSKKATEERRLLLEAFAKKHNGEYAAKKALAATESK